MPGLVGIIRKQAKVPLDRSLFRGMVGILRHRRWYEVDTYCTPDVAVARVHLGFINRAPQPYVSDSGRIKIFLHGEIYNDQADEANQVEFVARAYDRFGRDFANQLNGSFVVLIIDQLADTVMIATDRTASRPLFYFQDDAYLYFAPEPKALAFVPSLSRTVNIEALASFLACGHYLNGQVILKDLHVLANAAVLVVDGAGVTTHKYWQYTFNESGEDRGETYYREGLGELIRQAVRRRTRSEHRYGIPLSGGYDSRGILGCYLDEHPEKPLTTISWGVTEDISHSDCTVAKRLALKLGLAHVFLPLRPTYLAQHVREFVSFHDGLTDGCENYPESLKIFSEIRADLGVHIILRGDESFGFSRPACDERTLFEKLSLAPLDQSRNYRQLLRSNWLAIFSDSIRQTLHDIGGQCNATDIYLRQNFLYFDQRIKHYLNPLNYVKSLEVEVRTPYLDNDILDFMRELPSQYHFGKRFYRNLIRRMFPNLFSELATRSNLPSLEQLLRNAAMRALLFRVNLADSPLAAYFDHDAVRQLHESYLSEPHQQRNGRPLLQQVSKALTKWPSLHRLGYKMYLPILNRQEHDFITEGKILLRLLTMNLYLQQILKSWDSTSITPGKIEPDDRVRQLG